MEIRAITSREEQDAFVGSQRLSQFLQSWQWGEFQRSQQVRTVRLACCQAGQVLAVAQVIEQRLPLRKKYWYLPRGPVVAEKLSLEGYRQVTASLVREIASLAGREDAMFVKFEPPLGRHSERMFVELTREFTVQSADDIQPSQTLILDLAVPPAELQQRLHPKTRYNIKLAEKKGVRVRAESLPDDFESFWRLMVETSGRDSFRSHSKSYYREMLRQLGSGGFLRLYCADFAGQVIAANIVISFGDTVTYLHGASGSSQRNLMAPHLLQWQQILEAQRAGFRYYDFWGIAPEESANHPWSGITRFKRGFAGQARSYLGVYDLILDPIWYKLYKTAKKIKF